MRIVTEKTLQRLGVTNYKTTIRFLRLFPIMHLLEISNNHFWAEKNGRGRDSAFCRNHVCADICLKKSPKRTPENVDMTLVERTGSTRCFSFCMVQINLCDFGTFTIFAASCLVLRVHPLVVCKGDIMFQTWQDLRLRRISSMVNIVITPRCVKDQLKSNYTETLHLTMGITRECIIFSTTLKVFEFCVIWKPMTLFKSAVTVWLSMSVKESEIGVCCRCSCKYRISAFDHFS